MASSEPDPRALSRTGHECRPDAEADLVDWAPSGEFARDIGALRSRLIDGAGAVDESAVLALARAYIHFGFGAEAQQALATGDTDSTESRYLGVIASLIDNQPVAPGALSEQAGCLGAIALWSALAAGTLEDRSPAERTAVETAFRILPDGPRQAIATRVVALFLAAGQTGTATELIALAPTDNARSEDVVILRSNIAEAAETAAAARTEILDAIADGTRTGPGTMVRLVEATLASGQMVEPWMLDTLAALRFEQRDGPMAGPLALAEVRALTASGAFFDAADRLLDAETPLSEAERQYLSDDLMAAITERAGDADFLAFAFADNPLPLSPDGWNMVARRLIGLGFPDAALGLVDQPAEGDAMRDRRILRAEALRALGQDEEADLVLAGMADALPPSEDPMADWRDGDWEAVSTGDDPLLASAAEAFLTEDAPPLPDDTLAARANLITTAEETRAMADALLSRFPAPPTGEGAP